MEMIQVIATQCLQGRYLICMSGPRGKPEFCFDECKASNQMHYFGILTPSLYAAPHCCCQHMVLCVLALAREATEAGTTCFSISSSVKLYAR